ncbi:MAG: hypothetical protein WAO83_13085 [Fuerstiella sp.]
MSILMIVVGAFFCVASLYAVFGHGVTILLSNYSTVGWFSFAFMIFYGVAGGFTSVFHFTYIARGWPSQGVAGLYALAVGLLASALAVATMELIT